MRSFDIKLADEPGRIAALHRYHLLDTEPEKEFDDIIGLATTIFGLPMAAISLIDAERQWLKAACGLPDREMPRSLALCHHTIQGAAPLTVENALEDSRFMANPAVTGEPRIRAYLGVPLTTPEGYNVGSLCVLGTAPRRFTGRDRDVLARLGRLVVAQMELRTLARRDALTGLLSRRAFGDLLLLAAERARNGEASTLVLIDIDHFKSVNDRWGHPAGDKVLKAVSAELVRGLGGAGRLGRLGGEEFGALLRCDRTEAAMSIAQRLRAGVAALRVPGLDGAAVTVSCGVSSWHRRLASIEQWIAEADAALYAAKKAGRDRVVLAA